MKESTWTSLQIESSKIMALEKLRIATELRLWQYRKRGFPAVLVAPLLSALDEVGANERAIKRDCAKLAAGAPEAEFFDRTTGFGTAVWYVLGALPRQPGEYDTVSGLWKAFGLHVHDGAAVKRRKGDRGSHQRFRQELRAWVLYRLGEPHMKMKGGEDKNGNPLPRSPYRDVYDGRRERTTETHPPLRDEGAGCATCDRAYEITRTIREAGNQQRERQTVALDCSNVCAECRGPKMNLRGVAPCSCGSSERGRHWTDGHRHADALRVMTKAIVRDIYRVWRGQEPKFAGGQAAPDTQQLPAAGAVS